MPQGTRTAAEKVMFDWMLANVNLLYVGLNVLILLDLSTLSRFWTQFEAWLSMQMATVRGLEPAPEAARRCEIIPIHNTNDAIKQQLIEHAIAPDHCDTRKDMRDLLSEGSCCAIPGCEAFLYALACSVTL